MCRATIQITAMENKVQYELFLYSKFLFAAQVPRLNFEPTPEFPALQYFGELEKGGQAEVKGIKAGDFILEVRIPFPASVMPLHKRAVNARYHKVLERLTSRKI